MLSTTMGNLWSSITTTSAPSDSIDENTLREPNVDTDCLLEAHIAHGSEKMQHGSREAFGYQRVSGDLTSRNHKETRKQESGIIPQENSEKSGIEKIREVGKWTKYFCVEVNRAKAELGVKRTKENLVDLQLHLLDVEEFLETVPHNFQQTKEYEKLIKRYNLAQQNCINTEEWIEQKDFRNTDEGESCRIH